MSSVPGTKPAPRRYRVAAVLGAGVVLAEVVGAVVANAASHTSFATAVASFSITNLSIAVAFGTSGAALAWHRPGNAVGWLLLGSGVAQGATGVAASVLVLGDERGWTAATMNVFGTMFSWGWPWSMGCGLFLALLLFPTGRPPSPRWRPVGAGFVVVGLLFALSSGLDPASTAIGGRVYPHAGSLAAFHALDPLWGATGVLTGASLVIAIASLALRYRTGDDVTRRQLLWVLVSVILIAVVSTPIVISNGPSELFLLVFTLFPAAIVIAILRHNLLDIRLVLSRSVAWALLTGTVALVYVGLVSLFGLVLQGTASAVLTTAIIALGLNPARLLLQRRVDALFFGDRGDPMRVLGRLGSTMGDSAQMSDLAAAIAQSLKLPYVSIRAGDRDIAVAGGPLPPLVRAFALTWGDDRIGELVVGFRGGEARLGASDTRIIEVLVTPVTMAVHATLLAGEVQAARRRVVSAREDERRRLRRDLHDGLGPVLTAIGFKADAASNYVRVQPDEAVELLAQLRQDSARALEDVRRLVYDLRPPVLDDVGLVEAIRRHGERLRTSVSGAPFAVAVEAPDGALELPAAVEAAAYRVATEALTNVTRHSRAGHASVSISVGEALRLAVTDDGGPSVTPWNAGVGIVSMRERAAELGGTVSMGPGETGGSVVLVLPLGDDHERDAMPRAAAR